MFEVALLTCHGLRLLVQVLHTHWDLLGLREHRRLSQNIAAQQHSPPARVLDLSCRLIAQDLESV